MPLDTLDFTAGSPVRRLPLKTGETYSGDVSPSLSPAEPFVLLEAAPK